jgi:hypothetical protein
MTSMTSRSVSGTTACCWGDGRKPIIMSGLTRRSGYLIPNEYLTQWQATHR